MIISATHGSYESSKPLLQLGNVLRPIGCDSLDGTDYEANIVACLLGLYLWDNRILTGKEKGSPSFIDLFFAGATSERRLSLDADFGGVRKIKWDTACHICTSCR